MESFCFFTEKMKDTGRYLVAKLRKRSRLHRQLYVKPVKR
ncbi:MAG: hypothetical protein J07AB43_07200 [Candidatus Nanosalina sp. J07AB43]|nr:MAG: hypothetical protein J07AB43_07200 [Candidatus Nanosalina sp. J07AB43]